MSILYDVGCKTGVAGYDDGLIVCRAIKCPRCGKSFNPSYFYSSVWADEEWIKLTTQSLGKQCELFPCPNVERLIDAWREYWNWRDQQPDLGGGI